MPRFAPAERPGSHTPFRVSYPVYPVMHLDAFTRAVAAREWQLFERLVKAAYGTGATREELLSAVETARTLGDVSGPVVAHAYATVHNWQWMMMPPPALSEVLPGGIRLEPAIS